MKGKILTSCTPGLKGPRERRNLGEKTKREEVEEKGREVVVVFRPAGKLCLIQVRRNSAVLPDPEEVLKIGAVLKKKRLCDGDI
jgi:hypothetical protein